MSNTNNIELTTKIFAETQISNDRFGSHITLYGEYLAVRNGLSSYSSYNNDNARIDIFKRVNGNWEKTFDISNVDLSGSTSSNIKMGESLSMYGDYLAIGCSEDEVNSKNNAGSVYIFKKNSNNESWSQYGSRLVASDPSDNDKFGSAVSLHDGYIAIASQQTRKKVWIFKNDSSDNNFEILNVGSTTNYITDSLIAGFGSSISLNADHLIIGAKLSGNNNNGEVIAYKKESGNDVWNSITVEQPDITDVSGGGFNFGHSVSVHGNYFVAGSPGYDVNHPNSGRAYVYKYDSGTNSWSITQQLIASDNISTNTSTQNGRFGHSVKIYNNYILISANENVDSTGIITGAGVAYIFKKDDGSESWSEQAKLLANVNVQDNNFGEDIALSDDYILISSPSDDGNTISNRGVVYELLISELDEETSNICFLGHVLVETDQGKIPIKDITSKNSIDKNRVVLVTKFRNRDNYMILFKKGSLETNVPSEDTHVSKNHLIFTRGYYIKAEKLINGINIKKDIRGHDRIYNVLLKKHYKMKINNMVVETLNPDNPYVKV